jgi:peptide/nickel transport system substrate-binding protein
MFSHKRLTVALGVVMVLSFVLAACAAPAAPETIVQTVIVEGEVQTIEVTPTTAPVTFESADPSTFVFTQFGDPETFDPAWNYETGGGEIIQNTYETLVFYNRQNAAEFVPMLATDWTISEDGLTYTFTIREGVTFHNGSVMTPEDVAYSFVRGILQGGSFSPQWLLNEPFFGIGTFDAAEVVAAKMGLEDIYELEDDAEALQGADADALLETCTELSSQFVVDGNTVSMTLAQPWGPFLATIAQSWGAIQEKAWVAAAGGWDGECANWQNFYGINEETSPLKDIENGTGPFSVESWTPGEEVVLVRYDDYWSTEPAWEGAPSGPAALERVVIQNVTEWGTRFAMLQAGDTDFTVVPRQNITQVDPLVGEWCEYNADTLDYDCAPSETPNGPLRLHIGAPGVVRSDAFFVFDINTEGGNNLIGSGALDGNGIPSDFFADEHVRKAFNYCFDHDAFIEEALAGEAVQNVGVVIPGMTGYNADGPKYSFDIDACAAEMAQAWDGAVAENGFRFQIGYNTGNVTRQTVAQILQANFGDIDANYQIEIVGLPWPTFLANVRGSRIPIFISGWQEDIHDPHNWAQPFTVGTYGNRQRLPDDLRAEFKALVDAGVGASDAAARQAIYEDLTQVDYDNAPAIRLAVATGRHYEQRWVNGYYFNPVYSGFYYYSLSKN